MQEPVPAAPLRGLLLVAGAASLWGTWSLVLRPLGLPSTITSPIVLLLVGVWGLPLAWLEPRGRWDRTTWALLIANALFDAINVVTFFAAIEHTTVAVAVLTHYLAPILIALAAPRIEGVTTRGAAAAAAIATLGLAIVLEPWRSDAGDGVWLGAGLGAISAVAYASNVFVVRRLAPRIGPASTVSYHALISAGLLMAVLWPGADLSAIDRDDLAMLAGSSLVLGTIAGIAFVAGLSQIGSARAAVLTFLEPLVAVVAGWLVLGEALSGWALGGGALVLAAGVWVARAPAE